MCSWLSQKRRETSTSLLSCICFVDSHPFSTGLLSGIWHWGPSSNHIPQSQHVQQALSGHFHPDPPAYVCFKCESLSLSAPLYYKILTPYNPNRKLVSINSSLPKVKNKHQESVVPFASVAVFVRSWQTPLFSFWGYTVIESPRALHVEPPEKATGEHLCILDHDRSVPDVHFTKQSMYQPPHRALSEHLINGDVLEILSKNHGPSQLFYPDQSHVVTNTELQMDFLRLFCHSISNQKDFRLTEGLGVIFFHSSYSWRGKSFTSDPSDLKTSKRTTNTVLQLFGIEGRTGFLLLLHNPQVNGLMQ